MRAGFNSRVGPLLQTRWCSGNRTIPIVPTPPPPWCGNRTIPIQVVCAARLFASVEPSTTKHQRSTTWKKLMTWRVLMATLQRRRWRQCWRRWYQQAPVLGAVKLESDTPNPILSFPPTSYQLPFAHLNCSIKMWLVGPIKTIATSFCHLLTERYTITYSVDWSRPSD